MALTLALIFVLALSVRLAYLAENLGEPCFHEPQTEAGMYLGWAHAIRENVAPAPPFEKAPFYPYFVAALLGSEGNGPVRVAVVQCLLDAGTCLWLAIIAGLLFGNRAGLIAGLLAVGYGPFVFHTTELVPVTPVLFVLSAAMALQLFATRAPPATWRARALWAGCGIFWALTTGFRSEALLGAFVVGFFSWRRSGWRAAIFMLVPVLAYVAINTTINYRSSRHVVPLNLGSGYNLWAGNNPLSDGVNPFLSGPLETERARISDPAPDIYEEDQRFRNAGIEFFRDHPGRALTLLARKVLWTFHDKELPNTVDWDLQTERSRLFQLAPVAPWGFGVLFVLAAIGVVAMGSVRRELFALCAPGVFAVAICVLFLTNSRFRIPLALPILVLAAATLSHACLLISDRRRMRFGLGAGAMVAAVTFGNTFNVWNHRVPEILSNTGVCERAAGRPARAIALFERTLVDQPKDQLSWMHLVLSHEQAGNSRRAIELFDNVRRHVSPVGPFGRLRREFAQRHGIAP